MKYFFCLLMISLSDGNVVVRDCVFETRGECNHYMMQMYLPPNHKVTCDYRIKI